MVGAVIRNKNSYIVVRYAENIRGLSAVRTERVVHIVLFWDYTFAKVANFQQINKQKAEKWRKAEIL